MWKAPFWFFFRSFSLCNSSWISKSYHHSPVYRESRDIQPFKKASQKNFYVAFYFIIKSVIYLSANTASTDSQAGFLLCLGQHTELQHSNFHCAFKNLWFSQCFLKFREFSKGCETLHPEKSQSSLRIKPARSFMAHWGSWYPSCYCWLILAAEEFATTTVLSSLRQASVGITSHTVPTLGFLESKDDTYI